VREPFYRTSYSKALFSYVNSGFFARDLDADDHEFLEYVKVRGIANGSLPNTSIVSLEEIEFWDLPYSEAPGVERKAGPVPIRVRPIESPMQRAMRLARTNAWHARRTIRAEERAIAAAELEREQKAWEEANERRRQQGIVSDAEWEAAAPHAPTPIRFTKIKKKPAQFGKTVNRHYVPQWKVDEDLKRRLIARQHARTRRAAAQRLQAIQAEQDQAQVIARQTEQARRQAIIDEARQTVARAEQTLMQQPAAAPLVHYHPLTLKQAILTLMRGSHPSKLWTYEEFMRALGCDRELLLKCTQELTRDGQLVEKKEPAT